MKKTVKIMSALTVFFFVLTGWAIAENIVIKGSTTVLPIAQKVSEAYMKQNPDIKFQYQAVVQETV